MSPHLSVKRDGTGVRFERTSVGGTYRVMVGERDFGLVGNRTIYSPRYGAKWVAITPAMLPILRSSSPRSGVAAFETRHRAANALLLAAGVQEGEASE